MSKLISAISTSLETINNWRDKWIQSQIRAYLKDFRQRSTNHREYWFEKILMPIIKRDLTTAPNLISIFRGLMALPLLVFIIDEHFGLALAFFIFIMILDAIDGPLAKVLNQQSDLGEILDPTSDKIVFATVFLTLGKSYLTNTVFFTTMTIEIVIVFMALVLRPIAKRIQVNFKANALIWGKVKLNLQVIGCGIMLLGKIGNTYFIWTVNMLFTICIILAFITIFDYLRSVEKTTS